MASNKALPDYETTQMISLPPNTKNASMSLIWLNLAIIQVW